MGVRTEMRVRQAALRLSRTPFPLSTRSGSSISTSSVPGGGAHVTPRFERSSIDMVRSKQALHWAESSMARITLDFDASRSSTNALYWAESSTTPLDVARHLQHQQPLVDMVELRNGLLEQGFRLTAAKAP